MNNKGQALVEFVIILPIFIMILFLVIDFGMIINKKNELENKSTDIIEMIKNGENINKINSLYKEIDVTVTNQDNYLIVNLNTKINILTLGLNKILSDPYIVNVERTIYND